MSFETFVQQCRDCGYEGPEVELMYELLQEPEEEDLFTNTQFLPEEDEHTE